MQSISSRIWTRVAVSISYYGNYYTTGTTGNNGYSMIGFVWFDFVAYEPL